MFTVLRFAVLLSFIPFAGCVGRPAESPEIRATTPIEAVDPWATTVLDPKNIDTDSKHTVLAISAGGSDGAFGAGVLVGWSKHGSRPEFDIVTGVSTGALMSVFAFLGETYDPILETVYTSQSNKDVYRKRPAPGIGGPSLYDNTPLRKQIELYVDEETLERVAAQHDRGRRLYVATTNLDAGSVVIWDMGKIAKGGRDDKVLHFQKVLRASAAVPGFFEPVYIKPTTGKELRQAHVDGGVKEPVLLSDFMLETPLTDKNVYVIVNSNVRQFNDAEPVKANIKDISLKAISELLRELTEETIYRDYVLTRFAKAKFKMTAIPSKIPTTKDSLEFDPKRMQILFDAGYGIGKKGLSAWLDKPERLGEFER